MLECVINVSEGQNVSALHSLAVACRSALLDAHIDPDHNRTVFTLAGPHTEEAAQGLVASAINALDIRRHRGVHPRIGVVDVVPFIPLGDSTFEDAKLARDQLAQWVANTFNVPAFLYGHDRTLPEIRKYAFNPLQPDFGPSTPHETAGAVACGYREPMVAYNLWLAPGDMETAAELARAIRSPTVRALALKVGSTKQVSMNLLDPVAFGPKDAFEFVERHARIDRAELVGLIPEAALEQISPDYWEMLDLDINRTIERRLAKVLTADG